MSKPAPTDTERPEVDLAAAMANASADAQTSQELTEAVREGIKQKAKTFNTHSQALAGRLIAEERALVEIVADIDAKIEKLNEERTDAMLAHSGISNALSAMQRGRE